ncbi:unnamed protein product, partial [Prunus brigantina]
MAESVACFVIEKLVSLLISTEAKLSRDVRKEVGCIRDELESIRSFLKDADAKAAVQGEMVDASIRTWIKQVREAAYYIEDAIDEYLLCITRHHQDRGFLHKIIWLVKKMKPQDEIASKSHKMGDLLRMMIRQFCKSRKENTPEGTDQMDHESLISKSREYLQQKRYVVDYSISCIRLIRLWIAEGFVKLTKGKTLEEVGEEYLTELIHRSLVQVSKVYIDGKARSCRVHDLLHEVLLKKGMDSSFCHVLSEDESSSKQITRRLSIDSSSNPRIEHSHIRSVFTFNQEEWSESFLNTLSGNFKLLKVLDFTDAPLNHLPKYVGDLYLLKYLSLRNTKVKFLPESIGNLQNLETLDLKQSLVYEIPAKINKLRGVKIHDGIGSLCALQKLYHVEANHGGISLIKALGKLRQLRKLGLKNLKSEDGRALCASVENMNHLESLEVSTISEDEVLDLQSISTPPQFIRLHYLKGHLEKLPSWISQLQHLVKLRIFWSRLGDSPLKALQNLPNLLELGISYKAYDGAQLHFEGGFRKLKVLQLRDLEGLKSLIIDNGVMPLLKELHIGPSPQLKEVPSSIHHLRNLTTLRFINMPKEFQRDVDPKNGQHFWIVEHIRDVIFSYKSGTKFGIYE